MLYQLADDQANYYSAVCAYEDIIVIGDKSGACIVMQVIPSQIQLSFVKKGTYLQHQEGVVALAATNKRLLSGDQIGLINSWTIKDKELVISIPIDQNILSVTSMEPLFNGLIVASFGTGELRVYDPEQNCKIFEISAHARWINCISCHQNKSYVASSGEDGYTNVWSIEKTAVKLVASKQTPDSLLTGVAFVDDTSVAVVAYDDSSMYVFPGIY